MYAVIKTGGKQYRVSEGDVITIEKLCVNAGDQVVFDQVLAIGEGEDLQIGTPCVEGVRVFGEVVENGKSEKVIIYKYKSKKDYRKKQGHRQPYTMVKIVAVGGEAQTKAEVSKTEETVADKKISASMKKDELIAFAQENNIEVNEKATKAVIIETIEAALK